MNDFGLHWPIAHEIICPDVIETASQDRRGVAARAGRAHVADALRDALGRWSYAELEHEVRANLVYRAFARISCDVAPDANTILKIAQALGPDVIQTLHRRVVDLAVHAGVVKGRRLRVDTTVIEMHVPYPTDSSLLADGVRVVTRTLKKMEAVIGAGRRAVRNRMRSVTRRGLEIMYQARSPKTRDGLVRSYRRLLATTRAVLRDADKVGRRAAQRLRTLDAKARRRVTSLRARVRMVVPLVRRIIAQTEQRVLHGDTHVPDKVMSLFEPHTEGIRKGKLVKPTEFGKLVTIQEAEQQIVTAYAVHAERPVDQTLWVPALDAHQQIFHRAPRLTEALRPRRTNRPRPPGACDAWSCRDPARKRPRGGRTNGSAGFGAASGGASAVKAASAC